ncbi:hypothetical protein B0A50_06905 [Salinomyces thailandicus]|uniref:Protein PNS1 n=1 Tax=Salinomyces thailandicus TaxID=706561 RepID=A0A4U0TPP0_9PEZI|nr:hypothetical protein B0A50_06905 [Salinomyces thailandica]
MFSECTSSVSYAPPSQTSQSRDLDTNLSSTDIDASRFLQQSNAHLSFAEEPRSTSHTRAHNPLDRRRPPQQQQQRSAMSGNPYQHSSASQSRFPFASRLSSRQEPSHAPLFYSTAEDFQEEDEQDEHEREVADAWALQRSRQRFGPSNLTESSDLEDPSMERVDGQRHDRDDSLPRGRERGWYRDGNVPVGEPRDRNRDGPSDVNRMSSNGKERMEDVDLESDRHEEPPASLAGTSMTGDDRDDRPVPFQTFRTPHAKHPRESSFLPVGHDDEAISHMQTTGSPDRESVPATTVILPAQEPPKHDAFWASLFQISLFALFAAFVLVWFHTSTPRPKKPLGDTIYTVLRGSTNMLLWDTMIAILVALVWLALLRNYVRTLVFAILVAVPVILFAFSLYPLISSFRGTYHGTSVQDRIIRWFSFLPALAGALWTYNLYQSRHSLHRAINMLEFSTKILAASQYLVVLGFATLAAVVAWTWLWMLMFERIFLSGHLSHGGATRFLLDANAYWLGALFILQYLWTLAVLAGIQRATTAATVSQWYFHRLTPPQPSSREVVTASLQHATGALLGTICLSTLLALCARLPILLLPGRPAALLNLCASCLIPTSLAALTDPLALTYSAIHSQPLAISARALINLPLQPGRRSRAPTTHQSPSAYRVAKLLLHATRLLTSLTLGLAAWIRSAHSLPLSSAAGKVGLRGSLYAYIVGLIAATIGFAVLGAVENVVAAVLDAVVVCWAAETGGAGGGEARFCREAGELLGEEDRRGAGGGEGV